MGRGRTLDLPAGRRDIEDLGEPLVGAQALGVSKDVRGDHHLVGRRMFGELLDSCSYGLRVTYDLHRAVGVG